jgi:WD40 repeat protein
VYCGIVRDGGAYDVFLSYSRADSAASETLRARLEEAGLTAFLDRYGLPAGQPWQPWLEQHLKTCRALIVLVGPLGFGEWQHREIQLGLDRQASATKTGQAFPVIPVLLPGLANDAVPVGAFLNLNTWVDLRSGLDETESFQRLIAGAQGQAIDKAAELPAGLTPYRGLLPFREQDSGLFFGRERFVDDLVRKVGQRSAANVVAVIGRSGSGKSSIVYAGLFPKLRAERGVSGQAVWQILHLRPGAEPLHELARAFDPPKDDLGPIEVRAKLNKLASLLRDRQVTLVDLVRDRLRSDAGSTRLLLYVDQWEELYTLAAPREPRTDEEKARAADAKLFIDLVLEAAVKSDCTLVFSVRSDFYQDVQAHDPLNGAVQDRQVSLGPMKKDELLAVIEKPPKVLGASVEKDLTERLIRDIGLDPASERSDEYDIGKLPLLEYALEQAWAKRTGPQIGLAQYSGLEHALEERANELYGKLTPEAQAAAKRLFVSLVKPGEGREDTRARIPAPSDAATQMVIRTFADTEARLVVTDEADGRGSVEVTHEALIRHWSALRGWVDENRDNLRIRDWLRDSRADWIKHNRDASLLDIPRLHLAEAQKLFKQPGDVRIDDIKDYIEALLDHDRQRKEAEEVQQREELEAARRLADERARSAENERGLKELAVGSAKTARQRLWFAIAASVLLLFVAGYAFLEARDADLQSAIAENRTLEAKWQKATAEAQAAEANKQKALAEEQKAVALNNETHALAALSRAAARENRPLDGVELALAAWPRGVGASERPMLGDVVRYLSHSFSEHPPVAVLSHGDVVWGAVYSPDGKRILSWSEDKTLRLWDAATGMAIGEPLRHEGPVWGAVYSPDGKRIMSWSEDKTLRFWDATTGMAIGEPLRNEGSVQGARYSPDGKRILSWSEDKTLRLWDAATGMAIGDPLLHEDRVQGAVYSPDRKRVLSWSKDKTLRFWDATTGTAIGEPLRNEGSVQGARYSPDGKRILSWSEDKTLRLWDAESGAAIGEPLRHEGRIWGAVYSPDGNRILSWSEDKTLRLWDAATGAAIGEPLRQEGGVQGAVYSPDGKRILSWSDDKTLRLWDAATWAAIGEPLRHEDRVWGARYSPDGKRILSWSEDKTLRSWDAATGAAIGEPLRHEDRVLGAVYSSDGKRILSWSFDKTLRLWNEATGTAIGEPLRHENWANGAVYSPDGKRILSWSEDQTLRLWDASTGTAIDEPMRHEGRVLGAVYSPDGKRILSWSEDETLRFWDAATGAAIGEPLRQEGPVMGALYSPDGGRILSWSWGGTLRLWDAATGAGIGDSLRHEGPVVGAVYSPDGKRILSWSQDKTLRLWDAATGMAIGEPLRHEDRVKGAVYSPDGKRMLSWSEDKTLRFWDAGTGAAIGEPLRHGDAVVGAVYSPDGKRILSWSFDKTLRLWDAAKGASIGEPLRHDGPVWGAVYSPDGKRIMSWSEDKTLRFWDATTGTAIGEPLLHEGGVRGAVYSPDGKRIISWSFNLVPWSADKTLRFWDAATGATIGEALRHEDKVLGAVYSPDGKRILSWSYDKTLRLWDASWQGDNLFEIACKYAPIMSSREEIERISKRYGVKIAEPICQPGVKIPEPDWSRTEPAHAE